MKPTTKPTILSEAAARFTHANPNVNAFDLMTTDPNGGNEVDVRVIYTDLDGNQTTQYFGNIESAAPYNKSIATS